jgi:beta-lactamase regulating signal transducer with metallopeptidase domain
MNALLADPILSAAVSIAVKASILIGIAALAQIVLHRRSSAATRHLVWTLAIGGMLALPVLSLALPDWPVVIRLAPPAAAAVEPIVPIVPDAPSSAARPEVLPAMAPASDADGGDARPEAKGTPAVSRVAAIALVYATGACLLLIHLLLQQRSVRRLARQAAAVSDPEWTRLLSECARSLGVDRRVRLLRSAEQSMPMAFGAWRPAILIPAVADTWPADRRRAVILHELAHVARYDCVTQMFAFAACAMYWFHPASWWIARRLRVERELACDDRVIAAGTQPREYAGHLLEIAYAFGRHRAPALAVSMARPRQLEGRMLAVLDAARNRRVPALRARLTGLAIATALLLPLAAATATSAPAAPEVADAVTTAIEPAAPDQKPDLAGALRSVKSEVRTTARRLVRAATAAVSLAQDIGQGTWEIRPSKTEDTVQLRLMELNSQSGTLVPIRQLEGLSMAHLAGGSGPVQFRIRRDAGTLTFEGVFRNGVGAGTFSYTADPTFAAELAKRGFAQPTAREQYQMTRHDVGFAFIDELNKQGYAKATTSELVRAGQHGVQAAYVRDMAAAGYRLGSLEALITLRDHGVTPSYIRELSDLGYKGLPAAEIRRARDHGITPEFVRAMRDAGYTSLTMDELIRARDHGITADYVRGMREAGYGSLSLEQLVNARDHGVTVEFVRDLGAAGFGKLPIERLVRARDHGISPEYVREMRQLGHTVSLEELTRSRSHGVTEEYARGMAALGYRNLSIDALVRLRSHGVTTSYVQDLKTLGYENVSADDLVTLRSHGLTSERIRAANARAGTRLPLDLLKSLAAGGSIR